jgi:hypothetical protein
MDRDGVRAPRYPDWISCHGDTELESGVIDEVLSDRSSMASVARQAPKSQLVMSPITVGDYTAGGFGTRFGTSYEDLFDVPAVAPFTLPVRSQMPERRC